MLHKVQDTALKKSLHRKGFAFFMEQGLGKTLVALHIYDYLVTSGQCQRLVVVCPNSFKTGWVEEVQKWGFDFVSYVWESKAEIWNHRFTTMKYDRPPVLIVNYEAIRSEKCRTMIKDFINAKHSMIVADESVLISTHDSAQTKAAVELSKDFDYRFILSGKPMKQGPHDYWSQLRFIGLLNGVNYFAFRHKFCKMGGFKAKQVIGAKNEEELADLMNGHVFRATKAEWTDLPPKIYTTREYKLTAHLQEHFDRMYHDFITFVGGEAITIEAAITKYIKLAQIQAGFILNEKAEVRELIHDDANPRLNLLRSILDDEVQGKTIIPYHHRHSGKVLARALARYRPARLQGGMSGDEIQSEKARFNGDPSCRVILLQTAASKYGHTLLGGSGNDRCSACIFYENTYSLDDRSQIEDRIHRHGQDSGSVLYVDLVGTLIDRNMAAALQRKEDIFQSLMKFISGSAAASPAELGGR